MFSNIYDIVMITNCCISNDITHIFGDATLRIGSRDYDELAAFLERVSKIDDVDFIFTVSCDENELPAKIFKIAEKI